MKKRKYSILLYSDVHGLLLLFLSAASISIDVLLLRILRQYEEQQVKGPQAQVLTTINMIMMVILMILILMKIQTTTTTMTTTKS